MVDVQQAEPHRQTGCPQPVDETTAAAATATAAANPLGEEHLMTDAWVTLTPWGLKLASRRLLPRPAVQS